MKFKIGDRVKQTGSAIEAQGTITRIVEGGDNLGLPWEDTTPHYEFRDDITGTIIISHPRSFEKIKKHNFVLVPREKIIGGGPMNVFVRCKHKGCVAGIDWASDEDPEVLLKQANKEFGDDKCPYVWKIKKIK